jgi:hypothetical protein
MPSFRELHAGSSFSENSVHRMPIQISRVILSALVLASVASPIGPGESPAREAGALAGTSRRRRPSPRRSRRGSGRAQPSPPSSTEGSGAPELLPLFFSCGCGLVAALRAVARAPWGPPRSHLPLTAPSSRAHILPLGPGLGGFARTS